MAPKNILLAATGSIAAIRTPAIATLLLEKGHNLKILTTPSAQPFLTKEQPLPPQVPVHSNENEWLLWKTPGDPVLHIDLRKWAHALLIAPLSANSLARLATGICDGLLLCVARAWGFGNAMKPFIVAPAMNTLMWKHPVTEGHLNTIKQWGIHVILPIEKRLACGDVGIGAMQQPSVIVDFLLSSLDT